MGLLGSLGGAVKETARSGLVNGVLSATGNSAMSGQVQYPEYSYDANGNIKGVSSKYASAVASKYGSSVPGMSNIDGNFGGLGAGQSFRQHNLSKNGLRFPQKYQDGVSMSRMAAAPELEEISSDDDEEEKERKRKANESKQSTYSESMKKLGSTYGMLYNDTTIESNIDSDGDFKINMNPNSDMLTLKMPDWNYADFINERAIWQKGLSSAFDEPGWFYFKVFFNFDTNHGLFGGLLNGEKFTQATNGAAKYLYTVRKNHKFIKARDRITALHKFASVLSYINDNAPWYFKSIRNLNSAATPILDDFSKEQFIELEVTQDAIDMRLSTLMSLYSYACFDTILDKEIVPENLRKFDMTVILFQTPLRYLHTSFTSNKKIEFMGIDVGSAINEINGLFGKKKSSGKPSTKYKSMSINSGSSQNFADLMSMKIYTFMGCEFDVSTFASIIPSQMTNENPFQMGNSTIKITYSSVMEHTMNEFYGMMWGSDGFYFNQYNNFQLTGNSYNSYFNKASKEWEKQQERYQALKDTLEDLTQGGTILGLIDKPKSYKKAIDATEAVMNGLFSGDGLLTGLATNFALGALGSSLNTQAPQGNIYGDYGIGSAYYKDKLEMLKNGVHERTTPPYYYDPETGVKHEFHKSKSYSAYNWKNDKASISNFNVTNWLQTNTQKMASAVNDFGRSILGGSSNFTEQPYKPNPYNSETAIQMDMEKYGMNKSDAMVDGSPSNPTHQYVQKPYVPNVPTPSSNNERSEPGKSKTLVNSIKNSKHAFTEKPYEYDVETYLKKS